MRLSTEIFGIEFQNPVLLASGTCGFGRELVDVLDIESLGGFVTKSVTVEARSGDPAPRVTEFGGGMINSVGLANPGLVATRRDQLPWIASNVRRARVFVSVAGHTVDDYGTLVEGLDGADGFLGFEVNLSCPNDASRRGDPFALDPQAVQAVMTVCRSRTERPLLAKLAPNDSRLAETARIAAEAGADGLTLVNTLPGALLRPESGAPELGGGDGGVSGPALRPIGLRAVQRVRSATELPIAGVGGVMTAEDAVAYARAGASLVQVGTASFASPRAAQQLVRGLARWGRRHRIGRWDQLVTQPVPAWRPEPVSALEA
jgi:dihydroorotate dehydrogenase (NAD+) catalytic subunit